MANKNPNPATRFTSDKQPEKTGRSKEARDRLSRRFLTDLADDFEANGKKAIEDVRTKDPGRYIAAVASVIPKEVEISRPLDSMDDGQLAQAIELLADVLRNQAPQIPEEEPTVKHVN